jgi:hypothetical protein
MVSQEITERARAERLRLIRAELLARIRPVAANMPHDLFLEMIDGMAAVQLKYELLDAPALVVGREESPARHTPAG